MSVVDPTTGASEPGAGLHQEALPDFILIRTDEIDVGDRLRPVDPVWGKALGQIMLREGQRTPVEVCREPDRDRWTLVAGGHRHFGAVDAEIEFMRAEVVSADRDARRLREISENLWRSDLSPVDRAAFIAEAVTIYKRRAGIDPERSGGAIAADARWKKAVSDEAYDANDTLSFAYGWSAKVGEQIGLNKRSIERDLMLYRRLTASTVERLRRVRHPILSNASQLRALAKLEPAEQDTVSHTLATGTRNGRPLTLAQAREMVGGADRPVVRVEDRRLSAFIGAYARMSIPEKKGALAQLAGMLPAGFALIEGDQKPAKATFSPEHERYREETLDALDAAILFFDGLEEDEVLRDERAHDAAAASRDLRLARMTVSANGFELSAPADAVTPADEAADLRDTVRTIEGFLDAGTDPDFLIRELIRDDDETSWVEGDGEGAESSLTMDGVSATVFGDSAMLLSAWVRGAESLAAELEQQA